MGGVSDCVPWGPGQHTPLPLLPASIMVLKVRLSAGETGDSQMTLGTESAARNPTN